MTGRQVGIRLSKEEESMLDSMMAETGETNASHFIRKQLFNPDAAAKTKELQDSIKKLTSDNRWLQEQFDWLKGHIDRDLQHIHEEIRHSGNRKCRHCEHEGP